jgi:hypothetical protein
MNKDEALKMAIEALEQAEKQLKEYWNADIKRGYDIEEMDDTPILLCKDTINACKEALASNCEALEQPAQEVKDTIFSNYNENISKQVWNTKSGLEGTQFEITDDLK